MTIEQVRMPPCGKRKECTGCTEAWENVWDNGKTTAIRCGMDEYYGVLTELHRKEKERFPLPSICQNRRRKRGYGT